MLPLDRHVRLVQVAIKTNVDVFYLNVSWNGQTT